MLILINDWSKIVFSINIFKKMFEAFCIGLMKKKTNDKN